MKQILVQIAGEIVGLLCSLLFSLYASDAAGFTWHRPVKTSSWVWEGAASVTHHGLRPVSTPVGKKGLLSTLVLLLLRKPVGNLGSQKTTSITLSAVSGEPCPIKRGGQYWDLNGLHLVSLRVLHLQGGEVCVHKLACFGVPSPKQCVSMPDLREYCGSLQCFHLLVWMVSCADAKEVLEQNSISLTFFPLKSIVGNIHSIKAALPQISFY